MESMKEAYSQAEAKMSGKKPKDAPKLPKGWRYMPDGKVVKDMEDKEDEMEEMDEED